MIRRSMIVVLVTLAGSGRPAAGSPLTSGPSGLGQPGSMTLMVGGGPSWFDQDAASGLGATASIYWCPWGYLIGGARASTQVAGPGFMESGLRLGVTDLAPLIGLGATLGRFSASAAVGPAFTLTEVNHSSWYGDTEETELGVGLALDAGLAVTTGRSIDLTVRWVANLNDHVSAVGLIAGVQGSYGR